MPVSEVHSRLLLLGANNRQPSGCSIHRRAYLSDPRSRLLVRTVVQKATILVVVDSGTFKSSANLVA